MMHSSLFNVATRFDHLKPAQIIYGFVRPFNGLFHRVLHGRGGGAGEFNEFINWVFHVMIPVFHEFTA